MKIRILLSLLLFVTTACTDVDINRANNYLNTEVKTQEELQIQKEAVDELLDQLEDLDKEELKEVVAPIIEKVAETEVKVETEQKKNEVVTEQTAKENLSNDNYYTNSAGNEVHSPAFAPSIPAGASAKCKDGTYSFSQSRRGTCSHHGGVAVWY